MNLGQLRTEVRLRAQVPATDGIWTDSLVNSAINAALADLSVDHKWWWLQEAATPSHTSGAVDLSAVDPAPRTIAHVLVGGAEAQRVSSAEADLAVAATAPPYLYAVWGETLQIRPAPSGATAVAIRYYRDEPVLSVDSDAPLMPAAYHPAIVDRACSICFESLDDTSSAAMHEARARALLEQLTATAAVR